MVREFVVQGRYGPSTLTFDGNIVVSISQFFEFPDFALGSTRIIEDRRDFESDTGYPEGSAEIRNSAFRVDVIVTEDLDPDDPTSILQRTEREGYDTEGNLIWREVEDFDGTRRFDVYDTGQDGSPILRRSTTVDPTDAHAWAVDDKVYGFDGTLQQRHLVEDSGYYRAWEYRADGSAAAIMQVDFGDIEDGRSSFATSFAPGLFNYKETIFDSGIFISQELSEQGFLLREEKVDLEDVFAFESVVDTYDGQNGQQLSRVAIMDDGRIETTEYINGIQSSSVTEDHADVYDWWLSTETFNDIGRLVGETIEYDNGAITERTYQDRVLRSEMLRDGILDDGAFAWHTISRTYDANGTLTAEDTYWDDGVLNERRYEDGQLYRSFSTDTQDAKRWEWTYFEYDPNGDLAVKSVRHDNGREYRIDYVDGTRVSKTEWDRNDIYSWDTQTESYEADGSLLGRETTYDNGVVQTLEFTSGNSRKWDRKSQDDLADAFAWESKDVLRIDGQTVSSTRYDNGLLEQRLYDQNGVQLRYGRFDEEDVFDWRLQDTVWREDGTREQSRVVYDDGTQRDTFYDQNGQVTDVVWGTATGTGTIGEREQELPSDSLDVLGPDTETTVGLQSGIFDDLTFI